MTYAEYTLTHWEEPENAVTMVSKDGYVSVTPEWLYDVLQSYLPVAHREGEITVDLPVKSLKDFWKSLGGEIGVSR
ncbi:hypothetical protein SEA_WATERT_18 [Microbacterium phage WaterT]|nr:hypothetical protein SEA_WATERT_18 [Microbacterium phage WaterT]QDK01416.1 hypothetical protein SEA_LEEROYJENKINS_19 [Microbacterium phage LeeroyJenkins]QOC59343.1 hypothetical protein SEA_LIFES_17 [Microbacterium phage Lifes]USH44474.1 hypothetical protein SEA_CASSITA_19 [Microbacterium phage Cassita]